jgi:hypothetical protein
VTRQHTPGSGRSKNELDAPTPRVKTRGPPRYLIFDRDALIGGPLATASLRGRGTRGWFLASGGADAADLLGGLSVHSEMKRSQQLIGLGGAIVGIGIGLWGATRRRPRAGATES